MPDQSELEKPREADLLILSNRDGDLDVLKRTHA